MGGQQSQETNRKMNNTVINNINNTVTNNISEGQRSDLVSKLPSIPIIFSFLSPERLPLTVCKDWYRITREPLLWNILFNKYFSKDFLSTIKDKSMPAIKNSFISNYLKVNVIRKVQNTTLLLLKLGYPVRLEGGLSPSGCYYRVSLSMEANKTNPSSIAQDSFGSGSDAFGIVNCTSMTDLEFAQALIKKYNLKKAKPSPENILFQKWFTKVLASLSRWDTFYEYADWYDKPEALPLFCNCKRECTSAKDLPFFKTITESHPFINT